MARFLRLDEGNGATWSIVTCPVPGHTARDVQSRRTDDGAVEVRCRRCAAEARAVDALRAMAKRLR